MDMIFKRRLDALRKEVLTTEGLSYFLRGGTEAGAPRFMSTDHLTEKYLAICKKWEQNGSILVALSFLDNPGQGKCPASGLEPLSRPLRGCKSFP